MSYMFKTKDSTNRGKDFSKIAEIQLEVANKILRCPEILTIDTSALGMKNLIFLGEIIRQGRFVVGGYSQIPVGYIDLLEAIEQSTKSQLISLGIAENADFVEKDSIRVVYDLIAKRHFVENKQDRVIISTMIMSYSGVFSRLLASRVEFEEYLYSNLKDNLAVAASWMLEYQS